MTSTSACATTASSATLTLVTSLSGRLLLFLLSLKDHVSEVAKWCLLLLSELFIDHLIHYLSILGQCLPDMLRSLPGINFLNLLCITLPGHEELVHLVVSSLVQVQSELLLHVEIT